MNIKICPNCNSEKWEFYSGWKNDEPIESNEEWCKDCGFYYQEHIRYPIQEQIDNFRKHK